MLFDLIGVQNYYNLLQWKICMSALITIQEPLLFLVLWNIIDH